MNLNIIFGIILTYFLYKSICVYGSNKKICPFKFNQTNNIHLHHWIIHLLILIIFCCIKYNNSFIIGLNIGGVLHGLLEYDDWYIIFK